MTGLAVALTAATGLLAAAHLLWAIGYWTPIRDEAQLARSVIGWRGRDTMPGALPLAIIGTGLLGAALLPQFPGYPGRPLLLLLTGAIFFTRGGASYAPAWRRIAPEEPFATLDQHLFGPLYLGLAVGYAALGLGDL